MSITFSSFLAPDTSQSNDSFATTIEIIESAYKEVGVLKDGQNLKAEQVERGRFLMNAMIENWTGLEYFEWKIDFLSKAIPDPSTVNENGIDYICIRSNTSTLDNSPEGPLSQSFWNKLETNAAPAFLIGQEYLSGREVLLDPNIINVERVKIKGLQTLNELRRNNRAEFFELERQDEAGVPFVYYFNRDHVNTLFLHPTPDPNNKDYLLELNVARYPDIFAEIDNNPDFLREWRLAIIYNLALLLAGRSSVTTQRISNLRIIASNALQSALDSNTEKGDLFVSPNLSFTSMNRN